MVSWHNSVPLSLNGRCGVGNRSNWHQVQQRTSLHLPPQIHWFSIINSCVTVLLLTGFLATILMRVLKADFVKYSKDDRKCSTMYEGRHEYGIPVLGRVPPP